MGRLYATRKKQHGGNNPNGVNQYTVESLTSEPQKSTDPYTIEVIAEEIGKSPDTVWKSFQPQEEGRGLFRDYDLDC